MGMVSPDKIRKSVNTYMRKTLIISRIRLGCLALALGLVLTAKGNAAKPTNASQTAQSIMVNLLAEGTFAIVETNTYEYNFNTAAGYFTNAWDGSPPAVVSNTTSHDSTQNNVVSPPSVLSPCTPIIADPYPGPAPAPNPGKLYDGHPGHNDVVGVNGCAFLNGGLLTGDTYTQTATASGSCSYVSSVTLQNNGRYKVITTTIDTTNTYTYTYNITANAPYDTDPVAALTAWDLVSSTGGGDTAHVTINGQIAGESVISKTGLPRKYSFSLGEDPLNSTISRVQNLAIYVDDVLVANPASTVFHNAPGAQPGDLGAVDFAYTGNAGSNGVTSLLYPTAGAEARFILNNDSFPGNQDGGADGEALAWAIMDSVGLDLTPGTHSIKFTGTVKDNGGLTDIAFDITQDIIVETQGPGCGQVAP